MVGFKDIAVTNQCHNNLLVTDDICLRNIARTSWDHWVSNSEIRHNVLGSDGKSVDEVG